MTALLKDKGIDLDNNRFLILQVGGGVLEFLCVVIFLALHSPPGS